MNTEEKAELALNESARAIKSAQTWPPDRGPNKESLEDACNRLLQKAATLPRVANAIVDAKEDLATMEKLRQQWNAPRRHETVTQLDPDAKEWFAAYEKLRARTGAGFTAALVGKRGPGKTQIAMELMRYATAVGRSAYYCTAMDYFMRVKDTFHPDRKESQADAQKFFVRFKLLVIDEMNVRSDSPWEDNMLADLIGKRYNALLDTVLVSNESLDEFTKSIGPSIIDRLNETAGIIECNWRSFRE